MNRLRRICICLVGAGLMVLTGLLGSACSKKSTLNVDGGPCIGSDPIAGCGQACGSASNPFCGSGLFCGSEKVCTAQCVQGVEGQCENGGSCSYDGRCVVGGAVDPNECTEIEVPTEATIPNIVLAIDQSSTMGKKPDGSALGFAEDVNLTRWNVVRNFLIGDASARPPLSATEGAFPGIIGQLSDKIAFGLHTYMGIKESANGCPEIVSQSGEIATGSYQDIRTAYEGAEPLAGTPTLEALEAAYAKLNALSNTQPSIVLLASDGRVTNCARDVGVPTEEEFAEYRAAVEQRIKQANDTDGIRTFVINVGDNSDPNVVTHFQNQATNGGSANYFTANDAEMLTGAFDTIINNQVTCTVQLTRGLKEGAECSGRIRINAEAQDLVCNEDYVIEQERTRIRIKGEACTRLRAGTPPKVNAVFPCGSVTI